MDVVLGRQGQEENNRVENMDFTLRSAMTLAFDKKKLDSGSLHITYIQLVLW